MSNKSFRERYKYWKETGELPYSNGLIKDLPENQSEGVPVKSRLPGYDGGKDGMFVKYVDSYRVNPETGGVYDKVGDVREGAVILDPVEVVGLKPEWMRMQEEAERMRNILSRQGLSGADPIGLFAVETVALNPVFKAFGTAGLYTLGRYGESLTGFAKPLNWARAKLLTREMDRSSFGTIGSPVLQSTKRTKVGDVEIDNPGLYYHQSDAGKAKHFVETGRMRTPLEEYWLVKEEAGEPIPIKIRSGIEPGFPQDPGSAMFAQGGLWYGLTPKKPDLLVTAREMPIANKNASVMSNRASLRSLENQGSRRVTNDNIYTQGPHNRQNTSAYTWEPGYGYRRVLAEETPIIEWELAEKLMPTLKSGDYSYDSDFAGAGKKLMSMVAKDYMLTGKIPSFMYGVPSSWNRRLYTEYPSVVKDELTSEILPRMIRARKYYTPGFDEPAFKKEFWERANGQWISASTDAFRALDEATPGFRTGGFYDINADKLVHRAGEDPWDILGHEIRHRIDYNNLTTQRIPAENAMLRKAFNSIWRDLKNRYKSLKDFDPDAEDITSNRDLRRYLLGRGNQRLPLRKLDEIIGNATDNEIFDALQFTNGYTLAYAELLEKENAFTPELAEALRKSMQWVGMSAIPISLSIPTLKKK